MKVKAASLEVKCMQGRDGLEHKGGEGGEKSKRRRRWWESKETRRRRDKGETAALVRDKGSKKPVKHPGNVGTVCLLVGMPVPLYVQLSSCLSEYVKMSQ